MAVGSFFSTFGGKADQKQNGASFCFSAFLKKPSDIYIKRSVAKSCVFGSHEKSHRCLHYAPLFCFTAEGLQAKRPPPLGWVGYFVPFGQLFLPTQNVRTSSVGQK
jgi:hypothetical protein